MIIIIFITKHFHNLKVVDMYYRKVKVKAKVAVKVKFCLRHLSNYNNQSIAVTYSYLNDVKNTATLLWFLSEGKALMT